MQEVNSSNNLNAQVIVMAIHTICILWILLYIIMFINMFMNPETVTLEGTVNYRQDAAIIIFPIDELRIPHELTSTDEAFLQYAMEHVGTKVRCDIKIYPGIFDRSYFIEKIYYSE